MAADVQALLGRIQTSLGRAEPDRILVRDHDLTRELMGHHRFTDVLFLLMQKRLPEPAESRMFDAVLVALMEHGLMPSAAAARMTYHAAPDSIQGAIAAGVLGAGSLMLGTAEYAAKLLQTALANREGKPPLDGEELQQLAHSIVMRQREQGLRVPGIGHRLHIDADPRAERLMELATETGIAGAGCALMRAIALASDEVTGHHTPLNVTGAMAAVLSDMDTSWRLMRGFAILSRTAGLIAHIGEELEHPIAGAMIDLLRETSAPVQRSVR